MPSMVEAAVPRRHALADSTAHCVSRVWPSLLGHSATEVRAKLMAPSVEPVGVVHAQRRPYLKPQDGANSSSGPVSARGRFWLQKQPVLWRLRESEDEECGRQHVASFSACARRRS